MDGLGGVDDLVVAVAPAEPQQRVAHRRGQNAALGIGADGDGAVALGELGAVGPVDQRDMGVGRRRPVEGAEEPGLAKGVGEVVVPPDRMGDPHVMVVHDHREHVGGRAVGAQQHHVVERAIVDPDRPLHQIADDGLAVLRGAEADDGSDAGRRLRRIAVAPAPVVACRAAGGARLGPHRLQLVGRAVAAVGPAGGEQAARHGGMALPALGLAHDLAVPREAEPGKPVEDRRKRLGRGAPGVGILQPKQERAAMVARVEPVEEGGARAAQVQHAGRRRREARDDAHIAHNQSHPRQKAQALATDRNDPAFSTSPGGRRPAPVAVACRAWRGR